MSQNVKKTEIGREKQKQQEQKKITQNITLCYYHVTYKF